MKRIPNARDVDRALKAARKSVKVALKGLNQVAGESMARGRYEEAHALAVKAKDIMAFEGEIEALRKRWKALLGSGGRSSKSPKSPQTPLWGYYQPVLQALIELGGSAPRRDLEPVVARLMKASLQAGDFDAMPRGRERWQVSVQRTHRHLIAEGWIEDDGRKWGVTQAGRKAAKAGPASSRDRTF